MLPPVSTIRRKSGYPEGVAMQAEQNPEVLYIDGIPGVFYNGRWRALPRGGEGSGESGSSDDGGGSPPPPDTEKRFSQADVDRFMNERKRDDRLQGQRAFLEELGFDDPEKAKQFITSAKEAQKAAMDEADRKKLEAEEAKAASDRATANANALVLTTKIERALERAGVPVESSSEVRNMISVDNDVSDADLKSSVDSLKKKFPALFTGKQSNDQDDDGLPGGDPGNGPPKDGKIDPATSKTEAQKLLESRHGDEIKRRQEASRS